MSWASPTPLKPLCPALPTAPEAPVPPPAWHGGGFSPHPSSEGTWLLLIPCNTTAELSFGGKTHSSRQKGELPNMLHSQFLTAFPAFLCIPSFSLHSQLSTAATTTRGETVQPQNHTDLGIPTTWREALRILCSNHERTEQETLRPPPAPPWLFQLVPVKPG